MTDTISPKWRARETELELALAQVVDERDMAIHELEQIVRDLAGIENLEVQAATERASAALLTLRPGEDD